jgi:hypothetical protein
MTSYLVEKGVADSTMREGMRDHRHRIPEGITEK